MSCIYIFYLCVPEVVGSCQLQQVHKCISVLTSKSKVQIQFCQDPWRVWAFSLLARSHVRDHSYTDTGRKNCSLIRDPGQLATFSSDISQRTIVPFLALVPTEPMMRVEGTGCAVRRRTPRSGNSSPIMDCKLTCQALWPGGRRSYHDTGQWVNLSFPPLQTLSVSRPWEDGPQK